MPPLAPRTPSWVAGSDLTPHTQATDCGRFPPALKLGFRCQQWRLEATDRPNTHFSTPGSRKHARSKPLTTPKSRTGGSAAATKRTKSVRKKAVVKYEDSDEDGDDSEPDFSELDRSPTNKKVKTTPSKMKRFVEGGAPGGPGSVGVVGSSGIPTNGDTSVI